MKTIICDCEHASHFPEETGDAPVGHAYGTPCSYVVRVDHGLLVCGACEKAGHGQMRLVRRETHTQEAK